MFHRQFQNILMPKTALSPIIHLRNGKPENTQISAINLKNMQRSDKEVTKTECVGAHVVAYQFDQDDQRWVIHQYAWEEEG
jgi:hypothetical protein